MTLNFQPIWVFKCNSEKLTKKIKAEKTLPNLMVKKLNDMGKLYDRAQTEKAKTVK